MGIHRGMKFVFMRGKLKGRLGNVITSAGNEVLIRTSKSKYWVDKSNLEKRVRWMK